ncbi:hypothetical protein H0I23_01470 [Cellulophaga sp. HaHaR_3_176]|uniref:hypothetical protein n=1 Tax=Cellulophaga sp. HaHaR_3_176 TaxID=1942464 RepID=UPI001C1FC9D6|nr:hypothetical protein [Cellulophaga sp. HaHaR_3_176]QWX84350.1 hypothetical protein H0I23_01470 [Cellulophaga sp. HaHaR_3_176]
MIKTFAISLVLFMTSFLSPVQEQYTVKMAFEGLEDGVYYFSSEDDDFSTFSFDNIDKSLASKYNFSDRKLIGSSFEVTYEAEQLTNEDEEEYEVLTLKDIVKIEKK